MYISNNLFRLAIKFKQVHISYWTRKWEGLDLNEFHYKCMVLTQKIWKINILGVILYLPANQCSLSSTNIVEQGLLSAGESKTAAMIWILIFLWLTTLILLDKYTVYHHDSV